MRHSGKLSGATTSASYVALEQRIEDVRDLAGKDVTVSFYARGTVPGAIQVALKQDFGTGGNSGRGTTSIIGGVLGADIGTNWTKFTGTVKLPAIGATANGGTADSNTALQFYTYAPAGSGAGNTKHIEYDGVLELAKVQLEEGEKDTPFDLHEPEIELARCQRYYWQDGDLSLFVDGTGGPPSTNQGNAVDTIFFPTTMRTAPTMTLGYTTTVGSPQASPIGTRSATISLTTAPGTPDAQIRGFKADAEL